MNQCTDRRPRKVLILAHWFPPIGGGGVQRTLKFVRYLPQFGWQPVVLTVRGEHYYHVWDPSLLDEIPVGTPVYRTYSLELSVTVLRNLVLRLSGKSTQNQAIPGVAAAAGEAFGAGEGMRRLVGAWDRLHRFVGVPDQQLGWLPIGLPAALYAVVRERPDALYSTADPYTDHLLAGLVRALTGLPWIADFRDGWTRVDFQRPRRGLRTTLNEKLEGWVLERADRVVCAVESIPETFAARGLPRQPGKVSVIPHGFDPEDFRGTAPRRDGSLHLVHAGSLTRERSPEFFLRALRCALDRNPDLRGRVRVTFVGSLGGRDHLRAITDLGLSEAVHVAGYVPHRESVSYLLGADGLLFLMNDTGPWGQKSQSGKILEYLAAERPILALCPDGIAADLIRRCGAGMIASPDDHEAVVAALVTFLRQLQSGSLALRPDSTAIAGCTRQAATGQLAALLDTLTVSAAARRTRSDTPR